MTELRLNLLGSPQLFLNGVEVDLEARKPAALLYYLAVSAKTHSRDHLGTLFWPEQDQAQARAYLRRALWSLKQAGLEEWLLAKRESLALQSGYWLDVNAFQEAIDAGELALAADLYRGNFLAGFTLPDCPQFDEWQFFQAEGLQDTLAQVLSDLVEKHAEEADFGQAIDYARRWLALDPLREDVHRWLMRLYAYDGQQAAALRQYEECVHLLKEELGVEPEPETRDLYKDIRDRRLAWGVAPGQGALIQDRYLLENELGQGGMGTVYQARDTLLERPVAVKVLSKAEPDDEYHVRLLAEAKSAAKLNHPNIVAVYDAGETNGVPFIVMELLQGQTLRKVGQLPLEQLVKLARDVCSALDHAHQHGIIHRDLKPENVIITSSQTIKLADFGLAHDVGHSRLTQEGTLVGTIAFLAPELILGQPASPQSDLYALGMMLYDLAAGQLPFEGDNPAVLLTNHLHAPVVPPSACNIDIMPALDTLIVQLLDKDPGRRPVSAAEVFQRLERIAETPPADGAIAAEVPAASLLDRIARGRLVGREEELAEATQLWLRALSGQAGLLLISGEPGIGKTRLAQAIIAQARIGGATALRGGCYEFEATTPYLPLAEALRDWVHSRDGQTLRAQLGSTAPELARLAPEIETKLGPLPPSPPLSPEEQRVRLFDNIAQFLEGLAGENGLLLFVDDLHWADQGTLTLLSYLLRRLHQAHLLIVAAYRELELDRNHPLADALVQWNRQRLANRLQLARFTVAETNTLIATLFGQQQVSGEFAEAIHRETEGNPFFIEEVVKALVDQGQIYWAGDHWERDELENLAIPQSIKEAIGRRLNHLNKSCIDILHTAAVIGKDFPYVLLAAVSTADENQILDALEEAVAAQLIEPLANESFVFTHDKIREVLYDEILSIRRNRLHRQIVQAIEEGQAGDPADHVEDLAYHTIAANMLDEGLGYALKAAEKAQNVFAGNEALQYYRQAKECAESLGDRAAQAKIHEAMGDIYSIKGPFTTAVEHYEQAIALMTAKKSQAALRVKIGLVYNTINDEQGVAVLEQAQEELDPEEQPLEVAQALAALGRFKHYRAEYSAAISLFEKAHQLAEPLDDPQTLTVIYTNLAGAYQHMAQYEESMEWAQSAITLGERHDYLPAVAIGYEFFAENFVNMGYWQQSWEAAQKDRQIGEKIGATGRACWGQWCGGLALSGMGNLRQAVTEMEKALDKAMTIGEDRLTTLSQSGLAVTYADMGNAMAANEFMNRALDATQEKIELFQRGYAHYVSGYVYLQQENWRQAADEFTLARELMEHTEARDIDLFCLAYLAESLIELGEIEQAGAVLGESLALAQEVGAPYYEAITRRVQGRLLVKQGELEAAAAAFEQAYELADETGSRLELGRILYQRALMSQERGEVKQARQETQQAQSIFEECHAARDLEKATTLLKEFE